MDPKDVEGLEGGQVSEQASSIKQPALQSSNEQPAKNHFDRIQGKENHGQDLSERLCFACNRSLAKSRHLINVAGQVHKWHPECFKCHLCNHPLDRETSCHVYRDKIVCRNDYARLQRDQSTKCSRCRWPISASDWVRRAGDYVYHLACFSCDICLRQMSTGEQFTINIQDKGAIRLLCRLHFATEGTPQRVSNSDENLLDVPSSLNQSFDFTYVRNSGPPPAIKQGFNRDHYMHLLPTNSSSANNQALLLNRPPEFEKSSLNHLNGDDAQQPDNQRADTSTLSSNGSASMMSLPSKSKRVRTTFTEDQLSILQTHFMIDSNPDGQDLERIATITGLSKRVTQVWFQNSRARQKKHNTKRKPNLLTTQGTGIGLTASSSLQSHVFGHNQQQQRHHQSESVGSARDVYHANSQQQKWSSMSDRSDISLDTGEAILDELDDSRSTADQLAISEDSSD